MFNDANVGPATKIVLREADWLKRMNDMIGSLGANKTRYGLFYFSNRNLMQMID